MAGSSQEPLTTSDYLLGFGTLLTLCLIYNIFALMSGKDVVPNSPRPTRQQVENLSPPDDGDGIRKKQSGEAALLFFASFLGPILFIVGWSIREKKRRPVSRNLDKRWQEIQILVDQRLAEQSDPPQDVVGLGEFIPASRPDRPTGVPAEWPSGKSTPTEPQRHGEA